MSICLSNLIFMELEVKCLVGLKLFCLIARRMFQSMEFSPHRDLWYLESPRVLFWDRCCSFCLSIIFHALFNQLYVYLQVNYVLYREIVTHQDCLVLQQDLHRLFLRSKTSKNGKTCIRGSESWLQSREKHCTIAGEGWSKKRVKALRKALNPSF